MKKLDAIEIILTAPLWPKKETLPESCVALYDEMLNGARKFALDVVSLDFESALKTIGLWTRHIDKILESDVICNNEPILKLLSVYQHYCDALGINFKEIRGEA